MVKTTALTRNVQPLDQTRHDRTRPWPLPDRLKARVVYIIDRHGLTNLPGRRAERSGADRTPAAGVSSSGSGSIQRRSSRHSTSATTHANPPGAASPAASHRLRLNGARQRIGGLDIPTGTPTGGPIPPERRSAQRTITSTRRLRGSATPSAVLTSGSASPKDFTSMASAGTPSPSIILATVSARVRASRSLEDAAPARSVCPITVMSGLLPGTSGYPPSGRAGPASKRRSGPVRLLRTRDETHRCLRHGIQRVPTEQPEPRRRQVATLGGSGVGAG